MNHNLSLCWRRYEKSSHSRGNTNPVACPSLILPLDSERIAELRNTPPRLSHDVQSTGDNRTGECIFSSHVSAKSTCPCTHTHTYTQPTASLLPPSNLTAQPPLQSTIIWQIYVPEGVRIYRKQANPVWSIVHREAALSTVWGGKKLSILGSTEGEFACFSCQINP